MLSHRMLPFNALIHYKYLSNQRFEHKPYHSLTPYHPYLQQKCHHEKRSSFMLLHEVHLKKYQLSTVSHINVKPFLTEHACLQQKVH